MTTFQLCILAVSLMVGLFGFQPCFAGMTSKQIQEFKTSLPEGIDQQVVADFVTNFDDIRDWIVTDIISPTTPIVKSTESCKLCSALIGLVVAIIRSPAIPIELVKSLAFSLCSLLLVPGVISNDVCDGIVFMYADQLNFILDNRPNLRGLDLCGIYTGTEGGCDPIAEDLTNWQINLNNTKPALQPVDPLPVDIETVNILHLTDIHPDLHYRPGSLNDCGEPMCCRWGAPTNESLQAGQYGDYLCDMPVAAMREVFETAAANYNYKFVLMTGDLVHHAVWNTAVIDNINHFNAVNNALNEIFNTTPIYPVIGNHEPHPCNMFPPQSAWSLGYNISWVYDSIADAYQQWLPDQAQTTLRNYGYYTLTIPDGLRLIAINTNFCYINNFWLFYFTRDPENQLQWLADTLQAAENANEIVYIAGHIPPGKSDCWNVWNKKFHDIIIRYEAIIKAQFYGHTHNDETTIFFDKSVDPPRPANVLNIGVSTTAYTNINPGYKVFFADGARPNSTWEMVDHETWIYNLAEANQAGAEVAPEWRKLYSMKEAFDLESLRPVELYNLVLEMLTNDAIFQEYYRFFHKDSHLRNPCGQSCKMNHLCEIVKSDSSDYDHCIRLHELIEPTTPEWEEPIEPTTPEGDEPSTATEEDVGDGDGDGFAITTKANMLSISFIMLVADLIH